MGNSQYSWNTGCKDGVCPSKDCAELFLTLTDAIETIPIVSGGGGYPSADLLEYFQSCTSSGASLPCPTAMTQIDQSCYNPCPTGNAYLFDPLDIGSGKICRQTPQGATGASGWTSDSMALAIVISYQACLARIAALFSTMAFPVTVKNPDETTTVFSNSLDVALDAWPEFYHFYNNSYGQTDVDTYVKKFTDSGVTLPAIALDAFHNNFSDENQRSFGLLNEFDFSGSCGYFLVLEQGGGMQKARYYDIGMNPNWIIGNFLADSFVYDAEGTQRAANTTEIFQRGYFRKTLNNSNFNHDFAEYGSPFWTEAQRQDAYRKALGSVYSKNGKAVTNSKDWIDIWAQAYADFGLINGGRSADSYEDPADVPGEANPYTGTAGGLFDGELPKKPNQLFASDMIVRETVDTTLHGYKNECDTKSLLEDILPIGCAFVVGGVSSMIIPGQLAKGIAAVIGATSAYSVVSSIYGAQALKWWGTTRRNDGEKLAARLITFGFPAAFAFGLVELGYVPAAFDTFAKKGLLVGASGTLSYVLFEQTLEDSLVVGGDAAEILLSPVSWIDGVFHSIFDGCDKHIGNSNLQCYCENANSKPLLANAMIQDIFGCTGNQSDLRLQCMHAAMTTGDWGTDPVHMGTCDPSNGWMDSPTACLSAGELAYQQWNQSIDDKATKMWQQISPCTDPTNPSFLPATDADSICKSYGPYARQGGVVLPGGTEDRYPVQGVVAGKCYDFRAPQGQQELGTSNSYNWGNVKQPSECAIL